MAFQYQNNILPMRTTDAQEVCASTWIQENCTNKQIAARTLKQQLLNALVLPLIDTEMHYRRWLWHYWRCYWHNWLWQGHQGNINGLMAWWPRIISLRLRDARTLSGTPDGDFSTEAFLPIFLFFFAISTPDFSLFSAPNFVLIFPLSINTIFRNFQD